MYDYLSTRLKQIVRNYYLGKIKKGSVEKEVKNLMKEMIDFQIEIYYLLIKIQKEASERLKLLVFLFLNIVYLLL